MIDIPTTAIFGVFGTPVTFKLAGVDVGTVNGLFNPSSEVVSPYQAEAVLSRPEVWCRSDEVAAFDQRHTLTIDGLEFRQFGQPLIQDTLTRFLLVKA